MTHFDTVEQGKQRCKIPCWVELQRFLWLFRYSPYISLYCFPDLRLYLVNFPLLMWAVVTNHLVSIRSTPSEKKKRFLLLSLCIMIISLPNPEISFNTKIPQRQDKVTALTVSQKNPHIMLKIQLIISRNIFVCQFQRNALPMCKTVLQMAGAVEDWAFPPDKTGNTEAIYSWAVQLCKVSYLDRLIHFLFLSMEGLCEDKGPVDDGDGGVDNNDGDWGVGRLREGRALFPQLCV